MMVMLRTLCSRILNMRGFHHHTTHRNSAGTPPSLADSQRVRKNTTRFCCLLNDGGTPLAAASCAVTDFFPRRFCQTDNACDALRYFTESSRNDGNHATDGDSPTSQ